MLKPAATMQWPCGGEQRLRMAALFMRREERRGGARTCALICSSSLGCVCIQPSGSRSAR